MLFFFSWSAVVKEQEDRWVLHVGPHLDIVATTEEVVRQRYPTLAHPRESGANDSLASTDLEGYFAELERSASALALSKRKSDVVAGLNAASSPDSRSPASKRPR